MSETPPDRKALIEPEDLDWLRKLRAEYVLDDGKAHTPEFEEHCAHRVAQLDRIIAALLAADQARIEALEARAEAAEAQLAEAVRVVESLKAQAGHARFNCAQGFVGTTEATHGFGNIEESAATFLASLKDQADG